MHEDLLMQPLGSLWRDVVNFLADKDLTPAVFLPLLEHVAARPVSDGYFLGRVAEQLRDPNRRVETEHDIGRAGIADRMWREERDAILRWANRSKAGPFPVDEINDWWFAGKHRHLDVEGAKRATEFLDSVQVLPREKRFLDTLLEDATCHGILIHHLHKDLKCVRQAKS